ncbi:MAG: phytoene desaturase family protein [Syntrophothermus sp.]
MKAEYDAVVVGSGPNGLAAAITLLKAGKKVAVFEAMETTGGGMRTKELTLPGFRHDVCSAIHPLGIASPFFIRLPLKEHGLEWIFPKISMAHPFDDGTSVNLKNSITSTSRMLDNDSASYYQLMQSMSGRWHLIAEDVLGPFGFPRHPFAMLAFGLSAIQSASKFIDRKFKGFRAKGFFAGLAAHAIIPLNQPVTAAFGIILGTLGHISGWPMPKGGSQSIARAMQLYIESLGGEIYTNRCINSLGELPKSKVIMMDVGPKQLIKIAAGTLPDDYIKKLEKYRYGPGIFKVDYALSGPVPFRAPGCLDAGVIHIGGSYEEIRSSEETVWAGNHQKYPFVIAAQQSVFDASRAPEGKHTFWAYCHVPNGSTVDMTEAIEHQIERFAPGFKNLILARHKMTSMDFQAYDPNYIGGDINGGVQDWKQLFTRPVASLSPYRTPVKGLYICSSSTPPGGGVHGMCGYHAARRAIKDLF